MATFRQRGKSGSWTAQIKLRDGTRRVQTFPTKGLAQAWAREIEGQRDRGEVRDLALDKVTVADLWKSASITRKGTLSASTIARNESHWRNHLQPHWGSVTVASLRRSQVEAWVAEQSAAGVGTPTLDACVRLLGALCEVAVDDGVVTANPVRRVRLPKHQAKRKRFLSVAEVDAILAKVEAPDHRLLLELMAVSGLRIGEALGLRKADLGGDAAMVAVHQVWTRHGPKAYPKSDSSVRTVPVPASLRPRLLAHAQPMLPTAALFVGDDRNLNRRVLSKACEAAGVEVITLHELRHHAASVWVSAGVPMWEVSKALGHADTRMTERTYAHLSPGAHDRLLAARS